jgi:hypothetical protein
MQTLPYVYGTHNARLADINFREAGVGKSRLETALSLGMRFQGVPEISLQEGIEYARAFLRRCWFDAKRTIRGRDALVSYHRDYDDDARMFKTNPDHDWASNGSDAFRYLAVGHRTSPAKTDVPIEIKTYDPESMSVQWLAT